MLIDACCNFFAGLYLGLIAGAFSGTFEFGTFLDSVVKRGKIYQTLKKKRDKRATR